MNELAQQRSLYKGKELEKLIKTNNEITLKQLSELGFQRPLVSLHNYLLKFNIRFIKINEGIYRKEKGKYLKSCYIYYKVIRKSKKESINFITIKTN